MFKNNISPYNPNKDKYTHQFNPNTISINVNNNNNNM